MLWINTALASAAITAVVVIIDSHLLTKRMPSLSSYLLPVGITQLIAGVMIFVFQPLPHNVGVQPLLIAFGSGITNGISVTIMLSTMRQGEVSRIIPVVNSSPIFIALLAVPLLGEALGYRDWVGIVLAVAGAVLISIQPDTSQPRMRFQRSFVLLLLCSLLFALSNIGNKYALAHISFWNMFSIGTVCNAVVFSLVSLRPTTFKELKNLDRRTQVLGLTALNQCIVVVGYVLTFLAISKGPVSLVSTVINTRPAFVFILALVLSRFFPAVLNERLSKSIVLTKLIAIAMIMGGVTLLTLSR